ncbi:MAG: hypothetical protein LBJ36_01320 [Synergistaceae bacterium]|jgi:hypothetical protein|nr:hypothetical protein [Synergistaceae bacterium]
MTVALSRIKEMCESAGLSQRRFAQCQAMSCEVIQPGHKPKKRSGRAEGRIAGSDREEQGHLSNGFMVSIAKPEALKTRRASLENLFAQLEI